MSKRSRSIKLSKLAQINKVRFDNINEDVFELTIKHHATGENIVVSNDGVVVRLSKTTVSKMMVAVRNLSAKK